MSVVKNKIAIMQPYVFPYLGYFQLINAVDEFVLYDNIQYTKKGWINRNRILVNGKPEYISIPLLKDSSYLNVNDRRISENFDKDKLIRKVRSIYSKAPYFDQVIELFEVCIMYNSTNLFDYIYNALKITLEYIGIDTDISISSTIKIDHKLKAESKVKAICAFMNKSIYINPIGGQDLYSKQSFKNDGIDLYFLKPRLLEYRQFGRPFVSGLSIIDVMMFNSLEEIQVMLNNHSLL